MKFSKLESLIIKEVNNLRMSAAYNGMWSDGGSSSLSNKFDEYKKSLICKQDLRPSEYCKLDNLEVGEPDMFSDIIMKEKMRLAKDIVL